MTRVTENQLSRSILNEVIKNRQRVNLHSQEVSSGVKVVDAGDSRFSGTIARYQAILERITGYTTRINNAEAVISFQENVLTQANELLVRAKELAVQAANEALGPEVRQQIAAEVFQLRDHMVNLANSTYQGKYIFGQADDDDPPYDPATYTEPSSGSASVRYVFDAEDGTDVARSVKISDDLEVDITNPANTLFGNSIEALERLGRAVQGYDTTPPVGTPDGGGTTFATTQDQTDAIQECITLLTDAREDDIMPNRVAISSRLKRLETAANLLDLSKADAEEVLNSLQNADIAEAATNLAEAQNALEASFLVSSRVLNLTILDFV